MADTYSLADIVDKEYFATRDVGVTRLPYNGAPVVFTVKKAQAVGVVDTYLLPGTNRSNVWLGFLDANKKPYYMELVQGITDTSALASQGVKSDQQKADDQKTFMEKLPKYLGIGAAAFAGVYLLSSFIKANPVNR
jgi:hypothetical protein